MGFFLLLCLATFGVLFAAGVVAVRAVFWLVFLPFRIAFGILLFPLWLFRSALKIVGFAIVLPIVAVRRRPVRCSRSLAAAVLAMLVPLAPVLLVAVLLYLVVRSFSRRPMPVA